MNKYVKTALLGGLITGIGIIWEIGATIPEFFRSIIINIIFPPTYRLLEVIGLIIFLYGIWYNIQCTKERMEKE